MRTERRDCSNREKKIARFCENSIILCRFTTLLDRRQILYKYFLVKSSFFAITIDKKLKYQSNLTRPKEEC